MRPNRRFSVRKKVAEPRLATPQIPLNLARGAPAGTVWKRSRPSKKRLSFKLAKKLLRVRNDAVPYRNRQKRGLLMVRSSPPYGAPQAPRLIRAAAS